MVRHELFGLFQIESIQIVTQYQIFSLVNCLFNTRNIRSKIGQIVTEFDRIFQRLNEVYRSVSPSVYLCFLVYLVVVNVVPKGKQQQRRRHARKGKNGVTG